MIYRQRRIGFVTTSFPRYAGDFSGNFVFHMAEALAKQGFQIDVIVPAAAPSTTPKGARLVDNCRDWLRVFPIQYMYPGSLQKVCFGQGAPENLSRSPLTALLIPALVHQMWRRIEQLAGQWDGVVSHWLLPSALIAPRIPGSTIPHLAIAHSGDIHLLRRLPAKSLIAATVAKRCRHINFVSRQLRSEFIHCLPGHLQTHTQNKTSVAPMGVLPNTCVLTRHAAREKLNWRRFTVLYMGRLSPIKGVAYLIAGMEHCEGQLVIAGGGELRPVLEQQAKQLNIDVQFMGSVSRETRDLLFTAADALVVPSIQLPNGRHEGAPTVILEAMQAKLPVIATHTGGIPEYIRHHSTGLLVPEKNPRQIAKAINMIKENPDLRQRLVDSAASMAAQRGWDVVINNFTRMLFE
ncbi:MAG: glycosyltransferase family 4 protein [Deltaproteobacteria bacterium]|nr:glycosyltransferase family 4 protein [Deltaproteobacteria bacterium]